MYFKENDKIESYDFFREIKLKNAGLFGDQEVFNYHLEKADILKTILEMPDLVRADIRKAFIKIDFLNGDINNFITYLLNGHYNLIIDEYIKQKNKNKVVI
jgi:hypothetical protein